MVKTASKPRTPAAFREALSEDQIHRQVIQELRHFAPPDCYFMHPANGGWRKKTEAAIFTALGVQPGCPDLWLVHAGELYVLELKKVGGKLSVAQKRELHKLDLAGARTAVTYGLDEALAQLRAWGLLTDKPRTMIA